MNSFNGIRWWYWKFHQPILLKVEDKTAKKDATTEEKKVEQSAEPLKENETDEKEQKVEETPKKEE